MNRKPDLVKTLALVGTLLAWFPVVAPFVLSAVRLAQGHGLRFDYLMPAELFLSVLAGGGLLLLAARRARARTSLVAWAMGAAVAFLVGSQCLAVVSGLASGAIGPAGPWFVLVVAALVAYNLSVVVLGISGAILLRDLVTRRMELPDQE